MGFLKKLIVGGGAFFLIFGGGASTQSPSTFLQGFGFVGLVIGAIVIFLLIKTMMKAAGCLPSILVILGIAVVILYAMGSFNDGIGGVGGKISSLLGRSKTQYSSKIINNKKQVANLLEEGDYSKGIDEGFSETVGSAKQNIPKNPVARPSVQNKNESFLGGMIDKIVGGEGQGQEPMFDPTTLPPIFGSVSVISGDTLKIEGRYFRLFGIDAPEMNQSCASASGGAYRCGAEAASWLRGWLQSNTVECRVMQQDSRGGMVGICFLGDYDIGASIVNAGWAVAYRKYSPVYIPYEAQAKQKRSGLWQGSFYMPWDWKKLQTKKPKIKVIKQKVKSKGIFSSNNINSIV